MTSNQADMRHDLEVGVVREGLLRDWRAVMALRRAAQQFNGRLPRIASVVAELAASYPGLRDAVKVVNVLIANVSLADDVLGRAPIPHEFFEEVG